MAIDPGNRESGVVISRADNNLVLFANKIENEAFMRLLSDGTLLSPFDRELVLPVIEMVSHYGSGMPAGQDVFDTCIWIGRFVERLSSLLDAPVSFIRRRDVKLTLTGHASAKDSNVIQALVDRFAPGQKSYGKGTKSNPGWFYGFKADIWQAYALAVAFNDFTLAGDSDKVKEFAKWR